MTLANTFIYVQGKEDVGALFNECIRTVLFFSGRNSEPSDVNRVYPASNFNDTECMATDPLENLAAITAVFYKEGGPAVSAEEAEEANRTGCGDPTCTRKHTESVPANFVAGFCTPIEFTDEKRHWNVGDLHAALLWQVGAWLDGRKVKWQWNSNLTGRMHKGYEDLDSLKKAAKRYNEVQDSFATASSAEILRALGFPLPQSTQPEEEEED